MIAVMDPMNCTAKASNARMEHSNVNQVTALRHTSDVMAIEIVAICPMKSIVHRDSQAVAIALRRDSNVTTTSASPIPMFAME